MDTYMMIVWGIVLAVTVIAEICTVQMISIWFAISALVALILAWLGTPMWAQIAVFVVVTIILLIFTKDVAKKIFKTHPTNAELDIGKTAIVTEEINNERQTGRASLAGVYWIARSHDGSIIPVDTTVTIVAIDSAKLIVKANTDKGE